MSFCLVTKHSQLGVNGYTVSAAATRAIGASNERIARSANSAATCAPTPAWRCAS